MSSIQNTFQAIQLLFLVPQLKYLSCFKSWIYFHVSLCKDTLGKYRKKVKSLSLLIILNTHEIVLLLVKLQAKACNSTKNNPLSWVFSRFLNLPATLLKVKLLHGQFSLWWYQVVQRTKYTIQRRNMNPVQTPRWSFLRK